MHVRVRQALHCAVGLPCGCAALYLCYASWAFFPEPLSLDPLGPPCCAAAAARPPLHSAADVVAFAQAALHRYRRDKSPSAAEGFSPGARHELLGDMLAVLHGLAALQGTFEERALVTPSLPSAAPGEKPSAALGLVSPAEVALRAVLAVSLEQGWFDLVEAARGLFARLVRERPPPPQSAVATAVAELCALSYELERCVRPEQVSTAQRQRVAWAIDAFRPEAAVRERCTIAAEISVLPLVDCDRTTRCLMMARRSPGRRPQLIVTFVGTNTARNWWTNLHYASRPLPAAFGVDARAHSGFLALLQSIGFGEAAAEFDQVILVGHSMGGALAQLAGLALAHNRPERRVTVLTVASPRVLAVEQGKKIVLPDNYHHIRAFMYADVVPKVPPRFLGYRHVGTPLPLHTGCPTRTSFLGWGIWSNLFHSADMYKGVLEQPVVAQLHTYNGPGAHLQAPEDLLI